MIVRYTHCIMPRVSKQHLDARRQQILGAARRCFIQKGFKATSMQDILEEAGVSTGAVYRYFKNKDELITTIASEGLQAVAAELEDVLSSDDPPPLDQVMGRVIETITEMQASSQLPSLAIQIWAEASHAPEMRQWLMETINRLRTLFTHLIGVYQSKGTISSDFPPEAAGQVLVTLLPGLLLQISITGDVDAESFRNGLRDLMSSNGPISPKAV